MTKKIYNQPEVQVAQYASMTLMQSASPAGSTMEFNNIEGDQW
jgi:hypothetical protein